MATLLGLNLTDIPEMELLADGEYELTLKAAEIKTGKSSGKPYLQVILSSSEGDEYDDIFDILSLPSDDDSLRTQRFKLTKLKEFYEAFGIPTDGEEIDVNDYLGDTGYAKVVIESDEEYGDKNVVKRYMSPA